MKLLFSTLAVFVAAFVVGVQADDQLSGPERARIAAIEARLAALEAGTGLAAGGVAYSKLAVSNSITGLDIKDGVVSNCDVAAGAAIAESKLAALGESSNLVLTNAYGAGTNVTLYVTNGLVKAHAVTAP